jgi:hypothetical protein
MSQFYVVSEVTEDTFEATDDLQDAIRVAREVARQGAAGEPVSILDSGGKAVKQFVLMSDGTVAEQPIARPTVPPAIVSEPNRAEPFTPADRPRE